MNQITPLQIIKKNPHLLSKLPAEVKAEVADYLEELADRERSEKAKSSFMEFVTQVWPSFIHGAHHKRMAGAFEEVMSGQCKRLIVNMPPRHTKSEFASYLLPAWFLGKYPDKKVIQTNDRDVARDIPAFVLLTPSPASHAVLAPASVWVVVYVVGRNLFRRRKTRVSGLCSRVCMCI